jgi:hypothetical protein
MYRRTVEKAEMEIMANSKTNMTMTPGLAS